MCSALIADLRRLKIALNPIIVIDGAALTLTQEDSGACHLGRFFWDTLCTAVPVNKTCK
jgi:hypothetical protein